jgi:hypothetical protein
VQHATNPWTSPFAFALAAAAAAALVGGALAACHGVDCPEGTHEEDAACVANLAPECGPGTDLQAGLCVPSAGGAVCGTGTHAEAGVCIADIALAGNSGRLVRATFSAPPTLAPIASTTLTDALTAGDEIVMVSVYEPVPDAIRVFGGAGARNPNGTFQLEPATAFDAPATRAGGLITTAAGPIWFPAFSGGALLLEAARMADLTVTTIDGLTIATAGALAGVVTPENAEALYIDIIDTNFLDLLQSIGEKPDVDHDGDGTPESWTLALTFETDVAWLF